MSGDATEEAASPAADSAALERRTPDTAGPPASSEIPAAKPVPQTGTFRMRRGLGTPADTEPDQYEAQPSPQMPGTGGYRPIVQSDTDRYQPGTDRHAPEARPISPPGQRPPTNQYLSSSFRRPPTVAIPRKHQERVEDTMRQPLSDDELAIAEQVAVALPYFTYLCKAAVADGFLDDPDHAILVRLGQRRNAGKGHIRVLVSALLQRRLKWPWPTDEDVREACLRDAVNLALAEGRIDTKDMTLLVRLGVFLGRTEASVRKLLKQTARQRTGELGSD